MRRDPCSTNPKAAAFVVAAALCMTPFIASADMVMPPPTKCPIGTKGMPSHCGPHCEVQACPPNGQCQRAGEVCQQVDLCTETLQCRSISGPYTSTAASSVCGPNRSCQRGTCSTVNVCMNPNAPRAQPNRSSILGCRSVGQRPGSGVLPAGILLVGMALWRLRQRGRLR